MMNKIKMIISRAVEIIVKPISRAVKIIVKPIFRAVEIIVKPISRAVDFSPATQTHFPRQKFH